MNGKLFKTITYSVTLALSVFLVVMNVLAIIQAPIASIIVRSAIQLAVFVFVAYYALYAYKKPHGKDMKILMLTFAILTAISILHSVDYNSENWNYVLIGDSCVLAATCIVSHMAARLKKINSNAVYAVIAAILFAISLILNIVAVLSDTSAQQAPSTFVSIAILFSTLIEWLSIMVSYRNRFAQHREAKFADEAKKEFKEENSDK